MKVVYGVDLARLYVSAVRLVQRLEFPDLHSHWIHSVESVLPDGGFATMGPAHPVGELTMQREEWGREVLDEALRLGGGGTSEMFHGDPVRHLVEAAEVQWADLIAVGSERKGFFGSLFFGSVTKGLLMSAKENLLVAKGKVAETGPVKAVFATDYSPYAKRCLDEFVRLNPRGIEEIHVVSAVIEQLPMVLGDTVHEMPDMEDAIRQWVKVIESDHAEAAAKLQPLGAKVTTSVGRGHANDVIRTAMKKTGADLLILGAQGHGFLERLRIGSVSFHQVVSEDYSVLVLRV